LRVLVVGGCLCDLGVRPLGSIEPATSNAAEIGLVAGGVARNVAENLVQLGCEVALASQVGADPLARLVEDDLVGAGVEPRLVERGRTGLYVALLARSGNLDHGFCDPGGIEGLTAAEVEEVAGELSGYDGAVLDANLSAEALTGLAARLRASDIPYALEPVSNAKASRLTEAIPGCTLIKPNQTEARALTGVDSTTRSGTAAAARRLAQLGARNVVVSRGADGFHLLCDGFDGHVAAEPTELVDVTGAGDALLSAAFVGLLQGLPAPALSTAMRRCAALVCGSSRPVSSAIGPEVFTE
jgi:pseudouridine kinase